MKFLDTAFYFVFPCAIDTASLFLVKVQPKFNYYYQRWALALFFVLLRWLTNKTLEAQLFKTLQKSVIANSAREKNNANFRAIHGNVCPP